MPNPTRQSIFSEASKKLRSDFEEIRRNVPHKGVAGGEGEKILRSFFDEHLPKRFSSAQGFIIDKDNTVSSHQDVILYDALNCPTYRTSNQGMIIPSDNAAGVVEVKFDLTTTLLDSALKKINEVKLLRKTPDIPTDPPYASKNTYGVIFGFESKLTSETILKRWRSRLTIASLPAECNMIVVLDKGIFVPIVHIPGEGAGPIYLEGLPKGVPPGTKIGLTYFDYKEDTLDAMMRLLLPHLTFFRHRVDHPGFDFSRFSNSRVEWVGEVKPSSGIYVPATYTPKP